MSKLYLCSAITLLFVTILTSTLWAQQVAGQPSDNCEQITQTTLPKLQRILAQNDYSQIESALATIESTCGRTEFTQRVRILTLMILKQPTDSAIHYYLRNYLDHKLIDRLESAADTDYANIYAKHKAEFNYVPLRHPVDSLLIQKSVALLNSDLYRLNDAEETLAFLFSDHINTYLTRMDQEIPAPGKPSAAPQASNRTQRLYASEFGKERVGIVLSGGLYTPANAVNPIFRRGAVFGLAVMSPLSRNWIFDGFLKYRANNNSREFEYQLYDNIEWVKSRFSIMLGGSVGYKFIDLGRFLLVGKGGIAFEAVDTGLSESYVDEWGYSTSTPHTVNTYNLSFGLGGWQHLAGRTFAGLQVQYHYSPYNNYGNLITPIASDYISVELSFRF